MDTKRRTPAPTNWLVIYPSTHSNTSTTTRTVILIYKKLHPTRYHPITMGHQDITGLHLKTDTFPIDILNVYNDGDSDITIAHIGCLTHARATYSHKVISIEHKN